MSKSIANIEVDENQFNSTNHTENLQLPQFIATDKPGWLTDFNGAMKVIDEAAGVLQDQITEQFEDLESVHTQLDRVDDDINNPETGVRQVLHDTQTRVTDLEATVGDEGHGLVKDVNDLQQDMVETNTMAVKSNAQLGSVINLLCNKYSTAAQYGQGAYVYTENEDGSLNFLRCTETTHGAFNPDKWEDVTEKLISALDNSGGGGGSQYVLPIAGDADDPDAVLGGVIIGEGLSIDENGVLSRTVAPTEGIGPDYYASQVRAGLVRPNTEAGLNVNSANGVISIIIDDNTMEFTNDGKLKAKADTSRFAQGQGVSISNESVPTIAVRLAENSNLGFDGQGGLRAILPSSAYEIVQGDGVVITTDAQNNTKTISMAQASTNTLGGVRPKSDSFAFESYDPEHPENKKMTIQLKDKGGLQKQDGVGLSVKVDGSTIEIDQTTGELKAIGGGGGGTQYTAADNSVEIDNTNHTIGVKKGSTSGLAVGEDGLYVATGNGILKQGNALTVPQVGQTVNGVKQLFGTVKGIEGYEVSNVPGEFKKTASAAISGDVDKYKMFGIQQLSSSVTIQGNPSYTQAYLIDPPTLDTSVTPPVLNNDAPTIYKGELLYQVCSNDVVAMPSTTYTGSKLTAILFECIADLDTNLMYEVGQDENQQYIVKLKDNFSLNSYIKQNMQGIASLGTDKADIASVNRPATQTFIPTTRILTTGDVDPTQTREALPVVSTVYPDNRSITVPDRCKNHPLLFMFPLFVLPSAGFPITSNFNDYDIDVTYFVDCDAGDYDGLGKPLGRVPLFEKTMNVKPAVFQSFYDSQTTTVEIKDYRFGPQGNTSYYKYGAAVIYPMDVKNLIVCCRIEFTNISTGVVTRAYSEFTNGNTPHFNLYGATYLYDMAER